MYVCMVVNVAIVKLFRGDVLIQHMMSCCRSSSIASIADRVDVALPAAFRDLSQRLASLQNQKFPNAFSWPCSALYDSPPGCFQHCGMSTAAFHAIGYGTHEKALINSVCTWHIPPADQTGSTIQLLHARREKRK